MALELSADDLELLKQNPGGIYCIGLRDEVWQSQLAELDDIDDEGAYPKVYIGQACRKKTIKRRIGEHLGMLRKGKHHSPKLQHAWNKHGEESFECFVVSLCPDEFLNEVEEHCIWAFNAHKQYGYNVAAYAGTPSRGLKRSPETCAKMKGKKRSAEHCAAISAAKKGKPLSAATVSAAIAANKGKPKSTEHRAALSAAKKGKPLSAEHRAAISAANKGKPPSDATVSAAIAAKKDKPLSYEHRAAISAANKGKPLSAATRAGQRAYHARKRAEKAALASAA